MYWVIFLNILITLVHSHCLVNDLDLQCRGDTFLWSQTMETWNGRSILIVNTSIENFNCSLWPKKVVYVDLSSSNSNISSLCNCIFSQKTLSKMKIIGCSKYKSKKTNSKTLIYIGVSIVVSIGVSCVGVAFALRLCYRKFEYCKYIGDNFIATNNILWKFCNRPREKIRQREPQEMRVIISSPMPHQPVTSRPIEEFKMKFKTGTEFKGKIQAKIW